MVNVFLTKDIKIHTDSQQNRTATHKYHGTLIDSDYYPTAASARQAAVEVLREIRELS